MTLEIDESERQLLLLALALTAIQRPGWKYCCGETAKKFSGLEMFDEFMRYNTPGPFSISFDGASITCNTCKQTSHNINDVEKRYCGFCHKFHEQPEMPKV